LEASSDLTKFKVALQTEHYEELVELTVAQPVIATVVFEVLFYKTLLL